MNIVIPAFPGDLPNMVLQARSIGDLAEISDIDCIYVILIMHRNDKDNHAAVEDIIEQLISPLFGSLAPYLKVIRYGDLFPGTEGHSNSATAKQASAVAFAGRYVGIGDILILENGEGIADYGVSDCGSAADEPRPASDISDRYRSIRYDQARQLLNMPSEGTLGRKSSSLGSYLVSGCSLPDIDKSLVGGLSTVARRMTDGEIICDLSEIYGAWAERNHSPPHRERVPAGPNSNKNGRDRECASLRYAASDALWTRFGTGMDHGGLSSLMHEVADRVAQQEKWDAGLASRAIGLVNELRHGEVKFVQVGANDGEYLDPISPFVDGGDWSGLVIEPVPHYFGRLEQRYVRLANVMPLQCAVGAQSAQRTIYYVDEGILGDGKETGGPEWLKGIASFSVEHVLRHGVARESVRRLSVNVRKGSDILEQYFTGDIDLLVVDVEGAEREVLESFDLQHRRPACIIFECEHLGLEDEVALNELLRKSGYKVWWIRPDAVAIQSPSDLETALSDLMMEDR